MTSSTTGPPAARASSSAAQATRSASSAGVRCAWFSVMTLSAWTPPGRPVFPPGRLGSVEREALLSGLVHPGDRAPAPGSLAIVQAFVNTVDREHGPDLL